MRQSLANRVYSLRSSTTVDLPMRHLLRDPSSDDATESFDSEETSFNIQVKSTKQLLENDRAQRLARAKIGKEQVDFDIFILIFYTSVFFIISCPLNNFFFLEAFNTTINA